MSLRPAATLLAAAALAAACHTYTPAPVDLAAHAAAFAARRAEDAKPEVAASEDMPFDLADGLDLAEGGRVALLFAPACRLARAHVAVATATADHAGRWPDPVLGADFARILEQVPHRWLAAADLAITLPLSGRLGGERALAAARRDEALATAWLGEGDALRDLTLAWVRWSAAAAHHRLAGELAGQLGELAAIAQRLADAGQITQLAARAFELERLQRDSDAADLGVAADQAERHVRRALGLAPDAPLQLVPTLHVSRRMTEGPDAAAALTTSPRLWPLQRAHDAAEAALALEVRKQWPDLVLSPGWQEEDAQPRVALGLSLPLPLLAGNDGPIARAAAERELAAEALRVGYEELRHDLADAAATLAAARARRERATTLTPLAEQQLADGRRLAELGRLEPLLILDALVRAHAARGAAIDAELAEAEATIALDALFGEPGAGRPPLPETTR